MLYNHRQQWWTPSIIIYHRSKWASCFICREGSLPIVNVATLLNGRRPSTPANSRTLQTVAPFNHQCMKILFSVKTVVDWHLLYLIINDWKFSLQIFVCEGDSPSWSFLGDSCSNAWVNEIFPTNLTATQTATITQKTIAISIREMIMKSMQKFLIIKSGNRTGGTVVVTLLWFVMCNVLHTLWCTIIRQTSLLCYLKNSRH